MRLLSRILVVVLVVLGLGVEHLLKKPLHLGSGRLEWFGALAKVTRDAMTRWVPRHDGRRRARDRGNVHAAAWVAVGIGRVARRDRSHCSVSKQAGQVENNQNSPLGKGKA